MDGIYGANFTKPSDIQAKSVRRFLRGKELKNNATLDRANLEKAQRGCSGVIRDATEFDVLVGESWERQNSGLWNWNDYACTWWRQGVVRCPNKVKPVSSFPSLGHRKH